MSVTFKEFLSVYDDLYEDLTSLKQQSNSYAQQIQQLQLKIGRLMQLKQNIDRQLQANQNDQTTQKQNATQNAVLNIPSVAPGAAPGMNANPGSTDVF
jgi:predicted  nucleic acid-binding Zn-ribbon protein